MTSQSNLQWVRRAVKLSGNRYPADRGSLAVPENRANPASRMIHLPIIRIRATGAHTEAPIFHLAGGPGMSNLRFKPPAEWLQRHDVVLVGYRGVDGPASLDCPEIEQAMKGAGGATRLADLFSPGARRAMASAIDSSARRLQRQGLDLRGYTIPEVIADLEAAREALGYERIHLLGESFGTRIALLYAQRHPARIYRSVLVGVNPPGRFVWEADKIDQQLTHYDQLWAAGDKKIAFHPGAFQGVVGRSAAGLVAALRLVNNKMDRGLLPRWLNLRIDPGKVKAASFVMLFNRSTAAMVFDAYLAAVGGDASGLALLSLTYDLLLPRLFNWGDFLAKGFSADYDPARDYSRLEAPGSVMGSPLSQLFWQHANLWPFTAIPDEFRRLQVVDTETLLISGSLDFSTPADYATTEVLPYLPRDQQLIFSELGHTGDLWNAVPGALSQQITGFFDYGEVDRSSMGYQPVNFDVGWKSLPLLAKILAGGLVMGSALVTAGGVRAAVKYRTRKRE